MKIRENVSTRAFKLNVNFFIQTCLDITRALTVLPYWRPGCKLAIGV